MLSNLSIKGLVISDIQGNWGGKLYTLRELFGTLKSSASWDTLAIDKRVDKYLKLTNSDFDARVTQNIKSGASNETST